MDYGFATAESLGLDTYTTRTDTVPDSAMVDLGYHYPTGSQSAVKEERKTNQLLQLRVSPSLTSSSVKIQLTVLYPEPVEIKIFDLTGRCVRTLGSRKTHPGRNLWIWDGCDDKEKSVNTGTYFISANFGGGKSYTEKIIIIR